jgi:penicillin-binding protein 2
MFERRLKIFLGLLCAVTVVLTLRAGQVQVVQADRWQKAAAETMRRSQLVDTTRGSILDIKGRVLARDEACVNACVDYRAITEPPNEAWLNEKAAERLRNRLGEQYTKAPKANRREMVKAQVESVRADVKRMWAELAIASGLTLQEIHEQRKAIINRVDTRRRIVFVRNYQRAMKKGEEKPDSFWQKWILEGGLDTPELQKEKFMVAVSEETEPHVILTAIDTQTQNRLAAEIERYPGLTLPPSTHRRYPYGMVAAHLMGRVSRVNKEDLVDNLNVHDETRQYLPNDLMGRGGAEGLFEQALRGTRGRVQRILGEEGVLDATDPKPGRDVTMTIDVDLQGRIEAAFARSELIDNDGNVEVATLHGACVVIDVKSGEVRAMASYPTFDPNHLDELYDTLLNDQVNQPMLNRATMSQYQPGSTVKPLVGVAAITQGIITDADGIECTGYLVIDGKRRGVGRCWVASKFHEALKGAVAHHPVPWDAPHPTGFLTFGDALERSCNVYFETLAHRLGMAGLSAWYERFGLGRPTGVGIPEARGRVRSNDGGPAADVMGKTWFAGIGQDPVAATPIQMANASAMLARNGLWVRPRLVSDAHATELASARRVTSRRRARAKRTSPPTRSPTARTSSSRRWDSRPPRTG